jgi:hypothetical protein
MAVARPRAAVVSVIPVQKKLVPNQSGGRWVWDLQMFVAFVDYTYSRQQQKPCAKSAMMMPVPQPVVVAALCCRTQEHPQKETY